MIFGARASGPHHDHERARGPRSHQLRFGCAGTGFFSTGFS
jgi:hypothetical protein